MSNNEETSDSIVVISSLSDEYGSIRTDDNDQIRVVNENSSMESSDSVMAINEEKECYKLEVEIGKLKSQIDELKNENHVLKKNLDISRHQTNLLKDEKKSCLNCDVLVKKYNESLKESEKLLSKLKEYQKELDQSKNDVKETASVCENAFRELIIGLEELIRRCEEGKIQEGKECGQRNVQLEAIQLVSNNLIKTYKGLKIKEFDSKYETTLTGLIQSLAVKMASSSSLSKMPSDVKPIPTTNSSAPSPTMEELLGQVNMQINEDLSEFRQKTQTCKEKLSQQKQMIQSLLNKISMPPSSSTSSSEEGHGGSEDLSVSSNSEASTTSSCTSSSSSFQAQLQDSIKPNQKTTIEYGSDNDLESAAKDDMETCSKQQNQEKISHIVSPNWLYHCPNCNVSIDPKQIPWERFLQHKFRCGRSAVICTLLI